MTTRRDLCLALPALALLLEQASLRPLSAQTAAQTAAQTSADDPLQRNTIFRAATLPVAPNANGSSQYIVQGTLPTGEGINVHNATLLPGHSPHPPHRHLHSEFLLIQEGNVTWLLDGEPQPAGPGDILYAASNVLHNLHNTGTVTARYFVVGIGSNLKGHTA